MKNLDKLIQDQELIIQCQLMRGDKRSRYVASRAMDIAVELILIDEMRVRREESIKNN